MKVVFALVCSMHCLITLAQINPASIEIIRDQWGVPHIYAPTDAAVAYGLAWAHAEDDFATIQLTMLSGKQLLGLHLGKEGAAIDYVANLIRAADLVDREISKLSPAYRAVIEGYTAGINSYARHHPKEILLKGSFPVTVNEVLQAYVLSLNVISGADQVIKNLVNGKIESLEETGLGSNAIAISDKRTIEDQTFLAINSHQPLEGPVSWYEAHLVSDEGWNIMGGLFPGGATIFHGVNENLGWAHTVNYQDKIDVYQLQMNPKNELEYVVDGKMLKLEVREIKLRVKVLFGLPITVKKDAYWSIYGPTVKNDKGYFAFNLGALHDIRAPEQWYRMNKATDLKSFKKALEMVAIPGFSIIYADKYDSLYFVDNGKIPMRNPLYSWEKTVPGNTRETLTSQYHPLKDLPQVTNPKGGYIINTNHTPFNCCDQASNPKPKYYDATMGYKVWENNRSIRLRQLIEAKDQLNYDNFLKIKYDFTLPDSLAYFLDVNGVFSLNASGLNEGEKAVLEILQNWNRRSLTGDIGAAQFMIFYTHLLGQIKPAFAEYYRVNDVQLINGLIYTAQYLQKHFGNYAISLGEYQVLKRGNFEMSVPGVRDVIASMYSESHTQGRVKGKQGESYIMMVRFPKTGLPIIETVNVYGASNKSESPHYADQMSLFVKQQRKPMTLDIEQVRRDAKKIYHPQ